MLLAPEPAGVEVLTLRRAAWPDLLACGIVPVQFFHFPFEGALLLAKSVVFFVMMVPVQLLARQASLDLHATE